MKNLSLHCMKFSFGKKVQEIMTRKEVLVGSDAEMTLSLLGVYIYFNLFFSSSVTDTTTTLNIRLHFHITVSF